jgi:predicted PilT family ATPase
MTPSPNQSIRLNELNTILDEMKQGESAVKRLQELDNSRGMQDPADVVRRMRGNQPAPKGIQASGDALGDAAIAQTLRQQAAKMDAEAKGLLVEAQRLQKEAAQLEGVTAETTKPKKTTAKKTKVSA